jgi:aminopeptidase N
MRPCLAAIFVFAVLTTGMRAEDKFEAESTPGKLPKEVVPRNYLIHLEPNVDNLVTDGFEQVDIEVLRPTDRIVLNSLDIEISAAILLGANLDEELTPVVDETHQTVSFHPKDRLEPGRYKVTFKFQSKITQQPHGFFIQYYHSGDLPERTLCTQMEPTDARRVFPCWDEPSFRASYRLSMRTDKKNSVISNMPALAEQPIGSSEKIVIFDKTPPMASYLVVLACGKFEWLEDEAAGVKLRIVATEGKKESGRYALEVTKKILLYYNDYFGLAYPLPKLDQIALPSGFEGAMENWGGITYSEEALLYNPTSSSETTKQRIFSLMAHEMAHQWFGDLVTMAWWDNLWLNEGFASWMGTKAADHFNPDWQLWLRSSIEKERAMALDARKTTHPIQQSIADEAAANSAFDEITNEKGQCFIRMLENYLGETAFRDGIRAYLAANRYSNTTSENLWEALEQFAGKPIKKLAQSWTEQSGFPLIKMTAQCISDKRVISLEQIRFMLGEPDETPTQWSVPVGIVSAVDPLNPRYALLEKQSANFDFPTCEGAIKGNAGGIGFFRVFYEPALFNDLQNIVLKLPEADRLDLITDTWALVESGNLDASFYFNLITRLQQDDTLALWESSIGSERTMGPFEVMDRLEQGQSGRERYQNFICRLLGPKLAKFGWEAKEREDNQTRLLRTKLIETLGFFGDKGVIDEVFKRFQRFRQDPSSLSPELRPAVAHVVGRYSSPTTYDQLCELMEQSQAAEDRRMYLYALAVVLDPDLAKKTLDLLLSNRVPPPEAARALQYLSNQGEHPEIVWDYATQHLAELEKRFGYSRWNRLLPSIAEGFTDPSRADELLKFAHWNQTKLGLKEAENSANLISARVKLKAKELPSIDRWIENYLGR